MKIAVFSDTFSPKVDGVSISTHQFIAKLSEKGHKFIIFCPSYSSDDIKEIKGNPVIRLSSLPLPSYPEIRMAVPSLNLIRDAMNDFDADLVHFQTPGFIGQFSILAAKHFNLPVIGTYHTLVSKQGTYLSPYRLLKLDSLASLFEINNPVLNLIESISRTAEQLIAKPMIFSLCNSIYENANLILCPSRTIKEELKEAGIKTEMKVLSNGIDRKVFPGTEKKLSDGPFKILYAGRISFEKNCDVVLNAFEIIHRRFPDATMTFAGNGPALDILKKTAKEKNIYDAVEFFGQIPHEQLFEIYKNHDLFMTASTMETQGMVVLEAVSSGLPCVGVNSHALPELIHHGENGYLSDEGDFKGMAEHAVQILEDSSRYNAFSRKSIEISEEHDLDFSAGKLEQIYLSVSEINVKSK
ncbi:MAG: glycosyltransferase [Spirochaetia bacterium]|nr:glycosyltransferase [Spirochaetia bacterium]